MWQSCQFSLPAQLASIRSQLGSLESGAAAELALQGGRLGGIAQSFSGSPLADSAAALLALREQAQAAFNAVAACLCVHPWLQDRGSGGAVYQYLAPDEALQALADKCREHTDPRLPEGGDALVICLFAASVADFHAQLAAFNAVLPVPELQLLERRSKTLISHEADKRVLPTPPATPYWKQQGLADLPQLQALDASLGALQALADGYGADTSPVARLQQTLSRKQAHLQQRADAWNMLAQTFSGGAGVAARLSGSSQSIAQQLTGNPPAGAEYSHTAAVLLIGGAGALDLIAEAIGL